MNLKRDPEKVAGLGAGKRVNLILDLPGKMATRWLEPGDREAGCQHRWEP